MKYRFITILHNLKLESRKNKGIEIFPGARISNGNEILEETLKTRLLMGTAGVHSVDEFEGSVYLYIDGELEDIVAQEEMDEIGVKYTFFFLRQAQQFAVNLWTLKDNNIYIRDGFLINYTNQLESGRTFKASLSEVFTYSTGKRDDEDGNNLLALYSDNEIAEVLHNFSPYQLGDMDEYGGKYPAASHFFKNSGSERMDRAIYFTMDARRNAALPMKIISYCTALECLFTTGKTEVNHKIAERVAVLLGNDAEDKKRLFSLIKKAYDYRSTVIHGSSLKGENKDLIEISRSLDDVLRLLINGKHEIFSKKDKEIDDLFMDLLFRNFNS
ncbi:hypothetical protein KZX50_19770 [Bacillus infantis]|uniref:HEPN domain-containing protein n=1 Tax=Bacillus infantis TaxID=324767 RepID=UPI00200428EC|nr:HEPN domain-containing protein [Bacillus infantis]MCK6207684.1 hypothetical protein [Bacillus infantis]